VCIGGGSTFFAKKGCVTVLVCVISFYFVPLWGVLQLDVLQILYLSQN
jgi:hypothetical protein